uniref:Guanylate cyclase domain-containing protein n=1 Tax=Heterorhabditis bacteriophora TaxID=37862 RepID=A0A1I7WA83_HETBA
MLFSVCELYSELVPLHVSFRGLCSVTNRVFGTVRGFGNVIKEQLVVSSGVGEDINTLPYPRHYIYEMTQDGEERWSATRLITVPRAAYCSIHYILFTFLCIV